MEVYSALNIPWFNGGLFQTIDVPPLTPTDVVALRHAAALDWSAIDPSIFGTLFERGLDPKKRSQLGAHYTDPSTIMRIVEPVVIWPLQSEWSSVKSRIAEHLAKRDRLRSEAQSIPSTTAELNASSRGCDPRRTKQSAWPEADSEIFWSDYANFTSLIRHVVVGIFFISH